MPSRLAADTLLRGTRIAKPCRKLIFDVSTPNAVFFRARSANVKRSLRPSEAIDWQSIFCEKLISDVSTARAASSGNKRQTASSTIELSAINLLQQSVACVYFRLQRRCRSLTSSRCPAETQQTGLPPPRLIAPSAARMSHISAGLANRSQPSKRHTQSSSMFQNM